MPARHSAYVSDTLPTPDGLGMVTIDLYVLWPPGHAQDAQHLLATAVAQLAAQMVEAQG